MVTIRIALNLGVATIVPSLWDFCNVVSSFSDGSIRANKTRKNREDF